MELKKSFKRVGEFKHYTMCRFCHFQLIPVIHLGYIPLAGGFIQKNGIKNVEQTEKFYPLELSFCKNCFLLQSINVINPDTLFKNYLYFSSEIRTLKDHFKKFALELKQSYKNSPNFFVVEIGCNDGSLIASLLKKGFKVLGIDPASNIVNPLIKKDIPIINDYFSEKLAKSIGKNYGKADVIFSSNTLAHIEDMHDILKGIHGLLKKDGVLIFEVHYLGNLINDFQFDMIYHEHQYYYSIIALKNFFHTYSMEIFDVKKIPIHGGSVRLYVKKKTNERKKIQPSVERIICWEIKKKFDKPETYLQYSNAILTIKNKLLKLLSDIKKKNKKIAGYGASGRGTVLMNVCGIDKKYIDCVIDDAPAKQDAFTPGMHQRVVSSSVLYSDKKPDYVLITAWAFLKEIEKKHIKFLRSGGKFIIPLPRIKIITS